MKLKILATSEPNVLLELFIQKGGYLYGCFIKYAWWDGRKVREG